MTCYIRQGAAQQNLPAAIGTYDLLEAIAVAIARDASFWLVLTNDVGVHRFWLSPAQSIELLDDGDYTGDLRRERVDALVDVAIATGQMHAGLAYSTDEAFEAGMAMARDQQAADEADTDRPQQ